MTNPMRVFLLGLIVGLLLMIVLNLLAAHFQSDCGLLAVFGRSPCNDDIVRIGFPLVVFEKGGFAFRQIFNSLALVVDIIVALAVSVVVGLASQWYFARRASP